MDAALEDVDERRLWPEASAQLALDRFELFGCDFRHDSVALLVVPLALLQQQLAVVQFAF